MKVYILASEACYKGEETGVEFEVYATFERAKNALRQAINGELAEGTHFGDIYAAPEMRDTIVIDESEHSGAGYDDGAYTSNNVSYRIVEQEVVA